MGDYANYGRDLFRAVGFIYIALSVIAIGLALWLPKGKIAKAIAAGIVIALASILPIQGLQEIRAQQARVDEFKQRYDKAKALFDERCKTAGEKIYRTVEGVEGITLLSLRASDKAENRANPNWPDAALPNEAGGNDYIKTFLYWENHEDKRSARGYVTNVAIKATNLGYRHVDVKQIDGSVVRYRLTGKENSTLASETLSSKEASSRYAVSFINDVNPEDRNNWVAGTTIRVTDLQTKEVMAKKTTFSFEPGLGSTGGFRSPWGFAISCSKIENGSATRFFVDQIVKPSQEK